MSKMSVIEEKVAENYCPERSFNQNVREISKRAGINPNTCSCYLGALLRGVSYLEYCGNDFSRRFIPTEPKEIRELRDSSAKNRTLLDDLEEQERNKRIQDLLEQLSPKERALICSHFVDGKKYRELALKEKITPQGIGWRIQRILGNLRNLARQTTFWDYVFD